MEDIEYKISISKRLSNDFDNCTDIVLAVSHNNKEVNSVLYPSYGNISFGLEQFGHIIRRHFVEKLKDKFNLERPKSEVR